jgi:hypothetical protein
MLKKIVAIIVLLSISVVHSVEITRCGMNEMNSVCIIGEPCSCTIKDDCTDGNIILYYYDFSKPLCLPKIKDNTAVIDLVDCNVTEGLLNVVALCAEGPSNPVNLQVLYQRPKSCVWNQTLQVCQKNTHPLSEKCEPPYYCLEIGEGSCGCALVRTTTAPRTTTTTTIEVAKTTTTYEISTTPKMKPCPYECCDNVEDYEDLFCDEGYVCCPKENGGYACKKGNACVERKASGFGGWIVIILIVGLLIIGGAVYYFSKSKVRVQDKYGF